MCVSDIISSVVRVFQSALKPEVTLYASINPSIPRAAYGDLLRYRQIVQNLVANAVNLLTLVMFVCARLWQMMGRTHTRF